MNVVNRKIMQGIVFLVAVLLTACGGGAVSGGGAPGTAAPTVSSTSPGNNDTGVSVNAAITATFSEDMTASTVTAPGNFTLKTGSTTVPGTVTYTNRAATFAPAGTLANGTTYTAAITTGVKNAAGNAMTSARTWSFTTVSGISAPAITTQPQSRTVATGQTATFSVVASGSAPLSYQWQKRGAVIPGATSSSYTTPATTLADTGAQFTVVVGNSAGNVTSSAAVLTVKDVQPGQNGSRYPAGSIHSPITPTVATRLKALLAQGKQSGLQDNVFLKVGDSITAYPGGLLESFDGSNFNLGGYSTLETARAFYLTGRIGGVSPYARNSVAARVGMDSRWAVKVPNGGTDPLHMEMQAAQGAFAVIMFGTNDFASPQTEAFNYGWYFEYFLKLIDDCLAANVVPIMTAPPPQDVGNARVFTSMRTWSRVLRAMSQARQIPFIDYYQAMYPLPSYGLSGDGRHPNSCGGGDGMLTTAGLQCGYNMRNLVTLQSLDRVYQTLVLNGSAPDAETSPLLGSGTTADPYLIDSDDFSDFQTPPAGVTEQRYRLVTTGADTWKLVVASRMVQYEQTYGIEILDTAGQSLASSNDGVLEQPLSAGTYTIRVYYRSLTSAPKDYALAVMASGRP